LPASLDSRTSALALLHWRWELDATDASQVDAALDIDRIFGRLLPAHRRLITLAVRDGKALTAAGQAAVDRILAELGAEFLDAGIAQP
jgi:hypothetical protein